MATSKKRKKGIARRGSKSSHQKALFLPMDRSTVGEISLHVRLVLETIRQGRGDRASAHCMAQVTLLTGFLTQAGHGELEAGFLDNVELQVSALLDTGRDSGEWFFPGSLIDSLTVVVNEHDRQLRETRLQAIVEANNRLDKLIRSSPVKQRLVGLESIGKHMASEPASFNVHADDLEVVRRWRETNNYSGRGGVVVLLDGKVQRWLGTLCDPDQWTVNCVAIDEQGRTWINEKHDGTKMWMADEPF